MHTARDLRTSRKRRSVFYNELNEKFFNKYTNKLSREKKILRVFYFI